MPEQTLREFYEQGRIKYTKTGTAEYIRYLDEMPGMPIQDVWTDIPPVNPKLVRDLATRHRNLLLY